MWDFAIWPLIQAIWIWKIPLMARDTLTYVTSACLLDETAARYAIGCGDAIVLGDTEETRPLVFGLDGDDTYLLNGTTDFSG